MNSPSVLVTGPRRPRFSVHDETLKSRIPAGCAGSPSAGLLASIREAHISWLGSGGRGSWSCGISRCKFHRLGLKVLVFRKTCDFLRSSLPALSSSTEVI
jgi:hypothetical protein